MPIMHFGPFGLSPSPYMAFSLNLPFSLIFLYSPRYTAYTYTLIIYLQVAYYSSISIENELNSNTIVCQFVGIWPMVHLVRISFPWCLYTRLHRLCISWWDSPKVVEWAENVADKGSNILLIRVGWVFIQVLRVFYIRVQSDQQGSRRWTREEVRARHLWVWRGLAHVCATNNGGHGQLVFVPPRDYWNFQR